MKVSWLIMTKKTYKLIIGLQNFIDTALWQFIFMYTQLYIARNISDSDRALVGIFECALSFIAVTIIRNRTVIEVATRGLIGFQLTDMCVAVFSRFIVVAHPAAYMSIVAIRNSCMWNVTITVMNDLENKVFLKEERTDLNLILKQANMAGALIGSGISWLVVGINIESVCWIAAGLCVVSYIYEIWLGVMLKKLVKQLCT